MSAKVDRRTELPKQDPPGTVPPLFHSPFERSTHATLQATNGPELVCCPPAPLKVCVLNASDCSKVHIALDKSDTVGKVKEMFLLERPDLSRNLLLACNGKPVLESQSLEALNLKGTAVFVTYQRCVGG